MNKINENRYLDLQEYNKVAWDKEAERKCPWSIPVDSSVINSARQGIWEVKLTPGSMPADWLEKVSGKNILCLAAGGGQQAPVLAAAGAKVTVIDNSPKQLYREQGILKPKYTLPYSDLISLNKEEMETKIQKGEAICFGHTLTDQIAGQIQAGFLISGFYEDYHPNARFLIDEFMPTYIATKTIKPILHD